MRLLQHTKREQNSLGDLTEKQENFFFHSKNAIPFLPFFVNWLEKGNDFHESRRYKDKIKINVRTFHLNLKIFQHEETAHRGTHVWNREETGYDGPGGGLWLHKTM